MTAYPDWPVERVKQALFKGGITRANKPEGVRNTPGIQAGFLLCGMGWGVVKLRFGPPGCGCRLRSVKPCTQLLSGHTLQLLTNTALQ